VPAPTNSTAIASGATHPGRPPLSELPSSPAATTTFDGAAACVSSGPCDAFRCAFPAFFDGSARSVAVLCRAACDGLVDDVADDDGAPGVEEGAWPGPPD
jgi:hypothetical protein